MAHWSDRYEGFNLADEIAEADMAEEEIEAACKRAATLLRLTGDKAILEYLTAALDEVERLRTPTRGF
jgi:hypothetical protein